ncbi:kappaPI-actitoxin-Avd3e-like [Magallana gigas]|uniref:BPTI/Kunitz inhibitor domain-containing protein n=2 Tax=Magallana gigas TaxID=29159 RepID=A0A8W8NWB4_MAGGI|nr:kappaPI-actitoxin-Avd3e [Crassostrea gigas]
MSRVLSLCVLLFITVAIVSARWYGQPPPPVTGPCSLSAEPGPCRGACPRFYYDASRNSCRPFTYGCCGGNANNFKSKKLCERSCRPRRCPNIACFVGACTIQKCDNFPEATCFAVCPCDNSRWVYNGEDVTDKC